MPVVSISVPYHRKVADIEQAEKEKMRSKCNKIIDHGINRFINRQLIYNFPVRSDHGLPTKYIYRE